MPPPIPSMPYAQKSLYTPRYGDTIAHLLSRQGEIAAQGAARSGEIWGNFARDIGQIGGQAVQAYGDMKTQQKEAERQKQSQLMFEDAMSTFDPTKPMDTYRKLAVAVGPKNALEFTQGIVSIQKLQTDDATPDDFRNTVNSLWRAKQLYGDEYLAKNWPELAPALQKGAQGGKTKFLPDTVDLSAYTPEISKGIDMLHAEINPSKAQAGFELSPGQTRFDASGKPVASLPPTPEKPRAPSEPSFQAKEVLNDDGKPVMANFDSRSGRYVDPSTNQPIKNPRPVPSAAETQDSRKFQQAGPILRSVSELSEKINTLQGVVASAAGATAKAKAKINLDDDVAEYEALISGFTPLVARALGHTGVLTQQDVDSVKALFPRPEDSKSLRDRKVKRIKSIIGELEGGDASAVPASTSNAPKATHRWTPNGLVPVGGE